MLYYAMIKFHSQFSSITDEQPTYIPLRAVCLKCPQKHPLSVVMCATYSMFHAFAAYMSFLILLGR